MKAAMLMLAAFLAVSLSMSDNAEAGRRASTFRLLKYGRKMPARSSSSLIGEFASGAAGGAAGAWIYDQASEPKEGEGCTDCRRPYRERKELEERWRKGK